MTVPDYETLMRPLLALLSDGRTWPVQDIVRALSTEFELSPDDLAITLRGGKVRLVNSRVGWANTYLAQAGLISRPKRGHAEITDAGREALERHPDRIDARTLREYPAFVDFLTRSHAGSAHPTTPESAPSAEATPVVAPVTGTTLRGDPQDVIDSAVAQNHEAVASEVLDRLIALEPAAFERLVLQVLTALGYGGRSGAIEHTGRAGDGGIDGIIRQDPLGLERVYMQAKRYAADNPVGRPAIQAFVGALHGQQADRGVFLTTSTYSRDASEYVRYLRERIVLIDGARLAELMVLNNVGVQDEQTFTLKRLDEDFFDSL